MCNEIEDFRKLVPSIYCSDEDQLIQNLVFSKVYVINS